MSYMRRLAWVFLGLWLLGLAPAYGQEEKPPEKPWTGKLADGRVITRADLDLILREHDLWVTSSGKAGKRADLSKSELYRANLSGALLREADLRGINLFLANLSGANLIVANLSEAKLSFANLSGAYLMGTNLSGADLYWANLSGALFEPNPGFASNITRLTGIKGLSTTRYSFSPHSLIELRDAYRKAGARDREREVTCALNRSNREHLWFKRDLFRKSESLFNLVFFEWTCDYGMTPGRPLRIMLMLLFIFTIPYLLALRSRNPRAGIWLVLLSDRVLDRQIKDHPFKLTNHRPFRPLPHDSTRFGESVFRGIRMLRLAFYFSLLSAFNLGWRELNVGTWITRIQKREYTLRGTGWVRMLSGLQALFSVYLLALWVLTYFGRPFE